MDKRSVMNVGGSIEQALKGEYHIDVVSVLKEAWQYTLHSRVSINLGLLFSLIIGMIISFIVSSYMGGIEKVIEDPQARSLLNVIITLVISPFIAGVEMMGVFHAVGLKTNAKLIFAFLKRGSWVAVCSLLSSILVTIGFVLYLPGIFLLVALSLAIPLVVEKRLSPIKAIVLCIQATRFQWFKLFAIYFILALIFVLSLLPLLILAKSSFSFIGIVMFLFCFTYLAPFFYNVKGILYREIFGMQLHTLENIEPQDHGSFSA